MHPAYFYVEFQRSVEAVTIKLPSHIKVIFVSLSPEPILGHSSHLPSLQNQFCLCVRPCAGVGCKTSYCHPKVVLPAEDSRKTFFKYSLWNQWILFNLIFLILLMSCRNSKCAPTEPIIWMGKSVHKEAEVSPAQPDSQSATVTWLEAPHARPADLTFELSFSLSMCIAYLALNPEFNSPKG